MKLVGVIDFYSNRQGRAFAFIKATVPKGDGYVVARYFLCLRHIEFVADKDIAVGAGCGVLFNSNPPKRANDLPFAIQVEVYPNESAAAEANQTRAVANTVGALAKESANVNSH